MTQQMYPVDCPFSDCLYHVELAVQQDQILCRHPDKSRFRGSQACPLYQCNWAKKLDTIQK